MIKDKKISYPIVSICCITYNHAPFIRKALDGFLMQEPPTGVSADKPWYEILIHDDCSTDGTDNIIREYTNKYPDKIFPLFETENQYSKGKVVDAYNYDRARGKYIAVCEGDDYWTDPKKLQKQVDWMDAHHEYSACFHRVIQHNVYTGADNEDKCGQILGKKEGVDITPDLFFKAWYTQPLSMLFRTSMFDFSLPHVCKNYRDSHEIYYLLKHGKGYLFSFVGGVYNRHQGGIASLISMEKQFAISYTISQELYEYYKDICTKENLITTIQWIIDHNNQLSKLEKLKYIHQTLWLSGDVMKYLRNIRNLYFRK